MQRTTNLYLLFLVGSGRTSFPSSAVVGLVSSPTSLVSWYKTLLWVKHGLCTRKKIVACERGTNIWHGHSLNYISSRSTLFNLDSNIDSSSRQFGSLNFSVLNLQGGSKKLAARSFWAGGFADSQIENTPGIVKEK
jgi:hypothetical protein